MDGAARQRALSASLLQRAGLWREADARTRRLSSGRSDDAADATHLADDYRLLAHDLARARTLLPDSRTREYLDAAYSRGHATLHRGAWHIGSELLTIFLDEIPAVVSSLMQHILLSSSIIQTAAVTVYVLVH